jgi:hypothetical protein
LVVDLFKDANNLINKKLGNLRIEQQFWLTPYAIAPEA